MASSSSISLSPSPVPEYKICGFYRKETNKETNHRHHHHHHHLLRDNHHHHHHHFHIDNLIIIIFSNRQLILASSSPSPSSSYSGTGTEKNTFLVDSDYNCVISQIIFYTFHFHFYLFDQNLSSYSDTGTEKNTFLVDSDYNCVISTLFIFTFTFLTKIYHIKGVRSCHSSVSAHCPVTTKPTMAQSGLKQRLGRRALVEKFWKEVQEDKNGQDKRDRDKISFFSSILMITIHIPHHHHQ